ncbi:hypothetical protein KKE06_03355 [Candidatus Micrarchaeota archaeon]|nr:hypothetical protein [Candidatus Micrarchaeota archaeon]MBU1930207.1 hypothetical protein [Candidatus Micrarchaeota archaeon]
MKKQERASNTPHSRKSQQGLSKRRFGAPCPIANLAQRKQVREGRVFGKWLRLELRRSSSPPLAFPKEIAKEVQDQIKKNRVTHPHLTPGKLWRPVGLHIDKKTNSLVVDLATADFLTALAAQQVPSAKRMLPLLAQKHAQFSTLPYVIAAGVLVEITDSNNRVTHLAMVRRRKELPVLPDFIDFAAGMVRADSTPVQTAFERMKKEMGIGEKEVSFLGPGLKPARDPKNPLVFIVQSGEAFGAINLIYLARSSVPLKELRRRAKALGEELVFIPRTRKEIHRIIGTKKTVFPDVLKRYSAELKKS